ncbi:N-6 DNA methylase [Flavobacterium salilacus subsp. salilacus]|nr:restriction endonuclease subunit S [Flavobacterium salilacus]KAF2520185.1 N-6 DNA methylase [Flavobacterium salilacus subsp. salilacus]MBE1613899.1 restriction endonuclease subunit S [Flavobacterium sp. SaA2.13]
MPFKTLLYKLGFSPKDNTSGIYHKKYASCDDYCIEIDFENERFNYGDLIISDSKTTLNFSQKENWVVLECVNRLLEKGYQPQNIVLEKTWATGHGTSGRLDILVTRTDGSAYMMIECKTWGAEFEKELKRIYKDGGQLFTYFQQDRSADVLMLYASETDTKGAVHYRNEIVKIEDDYRQTTNVKDFYDRWSKIPKNNGVFDNWVSPYGFQSKALTPKALKEIKQEDSSFIFNQFLEILRHNVVSDKPNAFNKIFTLFLCKIYDEKSTNLNEELKFQWLEGKDDHIPFQKRLTDLYRKGMREFLEKEVSDMSDEDFEDKFGYLIHDQGAKQKILDQLTELRLKKNNEFAIKEVFDDDSFQDNAIVVKKIVELLQGYKIRYTKRHQYLSDFFEMLLTTGLKQESGQFFTPVPVAQFIIKSIPLQKLVHEKLKRGDANDLLPTIMDYAAGSGHFLTESMHEIQGIINTISPDDYIDKTARELKKWHSAHFDWAFHYVYGIEKDYRLVKVGKVGCYLHGDGLAQVIHGDGLARFTAPEYKGRLQHRDKFYPQENKQFDVVISNPPYSVSAFKGTLREVEKDFELYDLLTDQSSQIECLFIERTKQLLKNDGIAGIILPSSILSNTGIYTKAREIILKYFDIVAITELGSNTFMATGTNTVTLFLRRRSNELAERIHVLTDTTFAAGKDVTINGIEQPMAKYAAYVWEGLTLADYQTLVNKTPNEVVQAHELYTDYKKKIKATNDTAFWDAVLEKEKEKLFYFILTYNQKTVLIKSGSKDAEKRFLGYEFSNRRGSEGIHPIQRGKSIEECTQMFDPDIFDNPEKASTYVHKAFEGDFNYPIHETLQNNITRHRLVDMLTFDRVEFEKNISLSVKKKVRYDEIWGTDKLIVLSDIADIKKGTSITKEKTQSGTIPVVAGGQEPAYFHNEANREGNVITVSASGAYSGYVNYFETPIFASDCNTIISKDETKIETKLIYLFLNAIQKELYGLQRGQAQPHVYGDDLAGVKIPLPPKEIQEKIVAEIAVVEKREEEIKEQIDKLNNSKDKVIDLTSGLITRLKEVTLKIGSGSTPRGGESSYISQGISLIRSQNVHDNQFVKKGLVFIDNEQAKKLDGVTVKENDILFNITGASVARCCIVDKSYLPARVNQHVAIIRTNENVLSKYVQQILVSSKYKSELLVLADNSSTREAITKTQLEDFKIPLPPISEQQKIVAEIEAIEQQIQMLEQELATLPQQKEAVLKKYL